MRVLDHAGFRVTFTLHPQGYPQILWITFAGRFATGGTVENVVWFAETSVFLSSRHPCPQNYWKFQPGVTHPPQWYWHCLLGRDVPVCSRKPWLFWPASVFQPQVTQAKFKKLQIASSLSLLKLDVIRKLLAFMHKGRLISQRIRQADLHVYAPARINHKSLIMFNFINLCK